MISKHQNKTYDFESSIVNSQNQLFCFIYSLIHHKQDAEDLLQKTNLILVQNKHKFNPKLGSFISWAITIARYQVQGYRTQKFRCRLSFCDDLINNLADTTEALPPPQIQQQALNSCYSKLPIGMQSIAKLRYKKEMSLKEISFLTGRSIGAISSTLHRIRQYISKEIKEEYLKAESKYFFH